MVMKVINVLSKLDELAAEAYDSKLNSVIYMTAVACHVAKIIKELPVEHQDASLNELIYFIVKASKELPNNATPKEICDFLETNVSKPL
jgi:hypothetical protein